MNTINYLAFPLLVANQRQNSTLKKKWDRYHYHCHMARVKSAKAEIDNKPPKIYLHHQLQLKKIQMEQERIAVTERENQILMEKIACIMRTKGDVDNWNTSYIRHSNRSKQNKDIERITAENQTIIKRIQECKPNYDHREWESKWKAARKPLKKEPLIHSDAKKKWLRFPDFKFYFMIALLKHVDITLEL
ncbi:sperm axonemal maintenance protein CFAP97D1 [Gastrophryne carolinensis]